MFRIAMMLVLQDSGCRDGVGGQEGLDVLEREELGP